MDRTYLRCGIRLLRRSTEPIDISHVTQLVPSSGSTPRRPQASSMSISRYLRIGKGCSLIGGIACLHAT